MTAFQQNSFITVFTKKSCKNSEISTGAGIPADRKLLTGTGPAVYRNRFHLCYTLFIFHRRLRILSHLYSCAFREHILKSELTSAMQSVVGVALLRHSRLLALMKNLTVAYYVKSIPGWQNLSKKLRETSLTQVNDVRRETARMHQKTLGTWKQYNGRELAGGFRQLPAISRRIHSEIIGKFQKILGRNTASKFLLFPVFACRI